MVAAYNSQLDSKLYYQKLTLLLITRSSTSLSALHVVVLFESFTIAISLRKQKNHGNMYIAGFLYANCIIPFLLCIHGQRKLHSVKLFSMHDLSGAIYQKICICILWLDGLDLAIDSYQMRAFRMFLGLATHYTILICGMSYICSM